MAVYVGRCSYETASARRTGIVCSQEYGRSDLNEFLYLYIEIRSTNIVCLIVSLREMDESHILWKHAYQSILFLIRKTF